VKAVVRLGQALCQLSQNSAVDSAVTRLIDLMFYPFQTVACRSVNNPAFSNLLAAF
jgi:hypothetical protein